jgi:lipopolysaccharide export system permease protein
MICYALSLYIMPLANQKFRDIRTFFRDQNASILIEEEVFNTPMPGLTVFVRERDRSGNLYGILLHDARSKNKAITMTAREGRLETTAAGPRFFLKSGLRQERSEIQQDKVSWLSFDEYAIDVAFFATKTIRQREPDERSVFELFETAKTDTQRADRLRAEAHQRLLWPWFAVLLPMLMVALLQASPFNRRDSIKRSVLTIISAAVLVLAFFALRSAMAKQSMLVPVLYLLVFGAIASACFMLLRARMLPDMVYSPLAFLKQHIDAPQHGADA